MNINELLPIFIIQLITIYAAILAITSTYEEKTDKYKKMAINIMESPKIYSLLIAISVTLLSTLFSIVFLYVR